MRVDSMVTLSPVFSRVRPLRLARCVLPLPPDGLLLSTQHASQTRNTPHLEPFRRSVKSWNNVGRSAHSRMNIQKYVSRPDQRAATGQVFLSRNITLENRLQASNQPGGLKAALAPAARVPTKRGALQTPADRNRRSSSRVPRGGTRGEARPEMGEPTHRPGPYSVPTGLVAEQQTQSDVRHGALRTRVGCPA